MIIDGTFTIIYYYHPIISQACHHLKQRLLELLGICHPTIRKSVSSTTPASEGSRALWRTSRHQHDPRYATPERMIVIYDKYVSIYIYMCMYVYIYVCVI